MLFINGIIITKRWQKVDITTKGCQKMGDVICGQPLSRCWWKFPAQNLQRVAGLQRGHYPLPSLDTPGSSGRYPSQCASVQRHRGGRRGGGRHTPDVWARAAWVHWHPATVTLHRATNWWYWDTGHRGHVDNVQTQEQHSHLRSSLQLETRVREDFTITEKAPY